MTTSENQLEQMEITLELQINRNEQIDLELISAREINFEL